MKRSRLKRRRHPQWFKPEHQELRDEYKRKNTSCEYCRVLSGHVHIPKVPTRGTGLELDHIYGTGSKYGECVSNYIVSCCSCHSWKTDFDVYGRVAATWHKINKDPCEFDRADARAIFGQDVIGWVENKLQDGVLPDWAEEYALDLIEGF